MDCRTPLALKNLRNSERGAAAHPLDLNPEHRPLGARQSLPVPRLLERS